MSETVHFITAVLAKYSYMEKKKTVTYNYLAISTITTSNISYNIASILHKGAQERGPFQTYCIWKVTHNIKIRVLFWDGLVIRAADKKLENAIVLRISSRFEQLLCISASMDMQEDSSTAGHVFNDIPIEKGTSLSRGNRISIP